LRLKSLDNSVKTYDYTYDYVSNITSDNHKNFTYDDIYRLTQVNDTNSWTTLESYNYDNAWNRETDINNNEYTTNELNQYTSLSWATLSWSLTYDNNWNLTNNWIYTFEYDYKNRLAKVSNSSWIVVEFSYDVLWRRISKTVRHSELVSESIMYTYANQNILTEDKTENEVTTKKEYINWLWTDDTIAFDVEEPNLTILERGELNFCESTVLIQTSSFAKYGWQGIVDRCTNLASSWTVIVTNRYYLHKDNLWSVIWITNNSWSIVSTYEYDSYWNATLSWADIWNTILFTWREYDKEINLYYYRARYYSSELWRFISRDPIGQSDDMNLYAYVWNNPMNFVDPMGLEKILIVYSPNHWKDIFSISTNNQEKADILSDYYLSHWYNKKNVNIVSINTADDFINNINDSWIKKWRIIYVWHNQLWLSKNLTDENINKLNSIDNENVRIDLYGCETIVWHDWDITWSNQIAQKLANQLKISVSWSTTEVYEKNGTFYWNWENVSPGGEIKRVPSIIDSIVLPTY
jgi:RHS repeat-associated protein